MGGGFGVERFGQAYYGVDGLDLTAYSLVISDAMRAILSGDDPRAIECYADVTVGGIAVPYVESIDIERGVDGRIGLARIYVLCDASSIPAGIAVKADVTITAGTRFSGATASAQIFSGRVDDWSPPDQGEIRGTIVAYDVGKAMEDAEVSGQLSGDLATWIEGQASALDLGAGFSVVQRGTAVEIGRTYYAPGGVIRYGGPYPLSVFSSLLEAISVLVSATTKRYCFMDGAGDLVLLDPAYADASDPQFDFSKVISSREIVKASERFNRVAYTNLIGTGAGVWNIYYHGTYDDLADQAVYGVMELPGGVKNNLPISDAEMIAFSASLAAESQRKKHEVVLPFNPFIEVGSRSQFPFGNAFVASLSHSIRATGFWQTKVEAWEAAT